MPEIASAADSPAPTNQRGNLEHPRIVLLTNVIPPYHKPLLDRLARRYASLRVLLSTPMERHRRWRLEWEGLDVVVQKTTTLNGRWRHPKGFSEPLYVHLPLDTIHQLKQYDPEVLISWEMGTRTMLAAAYRWTRRGKKLIVWAEFAESTERGRGAVRGLIRRLIHRAVDAFIVTGASGARYLRSLGISDRKIFKISYTTEIARFSEAPLLRAEEHARRLLYVGQLIDRKGLLPFVRALGRWAQVHSTQKMEFVLAGDGPIRAQLEQTEQPGNVKLVFLGNVDYDELPKVYAEAGIFVLPSLADSWGVVVNEALAAGLPVLGSVHAQAVSELIEDGVNGWMFRSDDQQDMEAALERCLSSEIRTLDKMRLAARKTALSLTPDYVTDLVDRAVHSVLKKGAVRAP
jgi:glycosyltransferase involved in cell wall biosynthesis